MTCQCPDCGATYSGSETAGGHCRACHRTFTSVGAADKHRIGSYDDRTCVDLGDDWRVGRDGLKHQVPWRETARGWTHHPPREVDR